MILSRKYPRTTSQPPVRDTLDQRQHFQRAQSPPIVPPRAPNEGSYLREQYSPTKPLRKILRKPWGKSKSIDTPYLFPYTPPNTLKTALPFLNSNLRSKSPSPRNLDPNRKVQFLDVPPSPPVLTQRRSRSPIRAVANFFKKPTSERARSNSLSRFVKNLGNKIHHNSPSLTPDGYTSDSSITPYPSYDLDAGYVSDSGGNTRKLSVPITATNSIKNTFRKFSQGTVNFAKSLRLSNERLADNLNDYEWTKQNLLRSSELLNKSTERFTSLYSEKRTGAVTAVTKRNEKQKVSCKKLFVFD